jgi:hypothetical protein
MLIVPVQLTVLVRNFFEQFDHALEASQEQRRKQAASRTPSETRRCTFNQQETTSFRCASGPLIFDISYGYLHASRSILKDCTKRPDLP